MSEACLLDTSFFIRLLNDNGPLFSNALGYFKHFIAKNIEMKISTISIAEYCAGGSINDLPLRNLKILPFNIDYAIFSGEIARIIHPVKEELKMDRKIVINDLKLFSQAEMDKSIKYYLTSDKKSKNMYDKLAQHKKISFQFVNLKTPFNETFELLDI